MYICTRDIPLSKFDAVKVAVVVAEPRATNGLKVIDNSGVFALGSRPDP